MKKQGRAVLLSLLALCVPTLSGCMPSIELNERAIVQAIGVDMEDGNYQLTLQIFSPHSSGNEGLSPGEGNLELLSAEGKTIMEALNNVSLEQSKEPFLGNNKLIVVGRQVAEENLEYMVNFFDANNESRPRVNVVVAEETAKEVVEAKLDGGILPAQSIQLMLENQKSTGKIPRCNLMDLVRMLQQEGGNVYMPIVSVKPKEEQDLVACEGALVFHKGKPTAQLGTEKTRALLLLRDEIDNTVYTFRDEQLGQISVFVSQAKTKINCRMESGEPFFEIKTELTGKISEAVRPDGGGVSTDDVSRVEELLRHTAKAELEQILNEVLIEKGTDVFDFSLYLRKYQQQWWQQNAEHWEEQAKKLRFSVEVHSNIQGIGLEQRTQRPVEKYEG